MRIALAVLLCAFQKSTVSEKVTKHWETVAEGNVFGNPRIPLIRGRQCAEGSGQPFGRPLLGLFFPDSEKAMSYEFLPFLDPDHVGSPMLPVR
jgi:hypothetical protein